VIGAEKKAGNLSKDTRATMGKRKARGTDTRAFGCDRSIPQKQKGGENINRKGRKKVMGACVARNGGGLCSPSRVGLTRFKKGGSLLKAPSSIE